MTGASTAPIGSPPEHVLLRARDWARDYANPAADERVWGARLDRDLGDDLRRAVVRRVRSENRSALAAGIAVTIVAIALAVGLLLGLRALVALPPIPFALLTAAVALGVTFVASRWFRRIHAGTRYAARVLEVHRAFAADARDAARAALTARRPS